jgi:hypothetical protein
MKPDHGGVGLAARMDLDGAQVGFAHAVLGGRSRESYRFRGGGGRSRDSEGLRT